MGQSISRISKTQPQSMQALSGKEALDAHFIQAGFEAPSLPNGWDTKIEQIGSAFGFNKLLNAHEWGLDNWVEQFEQGAIPNESCWMVLSGHGVGSRTVKIAWANEKVGAFLELQADKDSVRSACSLMKQIMDDPIRYGIQDGQKLIIRQHGIYTQANGYKLLGDDRTAQWVTTETPIADYIAESFSQ